MWAFLLHTIFLPLPRLPPSPPPPLGPPLLAPALVFLKPKPVPAEACAPAGLLLPSPSFLSSTVASFFVKLALAKPASGAVALASLGSLRGGPRPKPAPPSLSRPAPSVFLASSWALGFADRWKPPPSLSSRGSRLALAGLSEVGAAALVYCLTQPPSPAGAVGPPPIRASSSSALPSSLLLLAIAASLAALSAACF